MPTNDECKKIIRKLSWKFGVSPNAITTTFLSADDKLDMINGDLAEKDLESAITVWIHNGMPDVAHGSIEPKNLD